MSQIRKWDEVNGIDEDGRMSAFIEDSHDGYAILQLRSNEDTVYELFASMKELERMGLSPDIDHYEVMYTEELPAYENRFQFLEDIYARFNMDRPDDFKGHSLSVSDIVVMKEGERVSSWYVDSFGFKELDGFVKPENYLKNAEMSMEDDYGMIDGIVNNGRKDEPAERTSVLEMLRGTGSKEMNSAVFRGPEEREL